MFAFGPRPCLLFLGRVRNFPPDGRQRRVATWPFPVSRFCSDCPEDDGKLQGIRRVATWPFPVSRFCSDCPEDDGKFRRGVFGPRRHPREKSSRVAMLVSAPASPPADELSEYERQRNENIRRNEAQLASLGLVPLSSQNCYVRKGATRAPRRAPGPPKATIRNAVGLRSQGSRRSSSTDASDWICTKCQGEGRPCLNRAEALVCHDQQCQLSRDVCGVGSLERREATAKEEQKEAWEEEDEAEGRQARVGKKRSRSTLDARTQAPGVITYYIHHERGRGFRVRRRDPLEKETTVLSKCQSRGVEGALQNVAAFIAAEEKPDTKHIAVLCQSHKLTASCVGGTWSFSWQEED